ncbi:hypothetical protein A2115_00710 [Candidatus Woesebacteria bacterium GWA1_41_8]|uniref:Capsule synthesis protein CapA domain-containing protein n=1 Tax=Candidatus Woesebacteria bacterium GWA1_41_8 TaxID=1802471 RepID=A0A1F7WKF0_9BACT|nr:MAG: hypothetical protein A2115_00710 [Candidatus Woesebacteria bacterium GWA1_41_8]
MKTIAFLYLGVAFSMVLIFVSLLLPLPQKTTETAGIPKTLAISTQPPELKVILTGDVMLGRTVETKSAEEGDYAYPFRRVGERLRDSDIVFINLENPIIEDCPPHADGFKFCASPKMLEGLVFSGVDIVNLANNHSGNYGQNGIEETQNHLRRKGIAATGLGELVILKREGTRFGFLGLDLTTRNLSDNDIELIRRSNTKVDVLILGVHWGVEYTQTPTDIQRTWAREIIQAGADVIAGHHPHWVQISEIIDGKPVYYSLGNFVFDQMWSEETKKGLLIQQIYEDKTLVKEKKSPIYMASWAQPHFIE